MLLPMSEDDQKKSDSGRTEPKDDDSRDLLQDWKKLNQDPPSVKDGPLPKKDSDDRMQGWKKLNENPPSVKDGPPPKK